MVELGAGAAANGVGGAWFAAYPCPCKWTCGGATDDECPFICAGGPDPGAASEEEGAAGAGTACESRGDSSCWAWMGVGVGVVVVVVVAVAAGFGVCDCDCEVARAASKSMLKCACVCVCVYVVFGRKKGKNVLDFGLEVLFFFGCALNFASAICVRLCCVCVLYDVCMYV